LPDNALVRLHRGAILKALGRDAAALVELHEARRLGLPEKRLPEADALIKEIDRPAGPG
ncbi:MAG: hypothetical protein GX595_07095, partial [Lentisphaerae bacterium]|nr:hypothetical protein [Lentisphaerota bacterium]